MGKLFIINIQLDFNMTILINFRFCTLFVVAFPLAPFFALINNIFELRLDARKFLTYFKRPVPKRVKDIGIWLQVMNVLSRMAIITTAFISKFYKNFHENFNIIVIQFFSCIFIKFHSTFSIWNVKRTSKYGLPRLLLCNI
jgi:hypothetical protein